MSFDQESNLFLDVCGIAAGIMMLIALIRWRRTGRLGIETQQAGAGYGVVLIVAFTQVLRSESPIIARGIFAVTSIMAICGLGIVLQNRGKHRGP